MQMTGLFKYTDKTITNAENIESLGLGSAAVGFTRGINAREPRVWGMRFGMKF